VIPSVPKVPATRISALKSSTRNRRQHSAEVNQLATGFPPVNWPKTTTNQQPTTNNNQQLPTNNQPTNQPTKQTNKQTSKQTKKKGDLECGVGVANAPEPIVRGWMQGPPGELRHDKR